MTANRNPNRPFEFDPSFDLGQAKDVVNAALARSPVTGWCTSGDAVGHRGVTFCTAEQLQAKRVKLRALAQRLLESDEFDMAALVTLVATRFGVDRVNQALVSAVPTCDIDTAIHWLADARHAA